VKWGLPWDIVEDRVKGAGIKWSLTGVWLMGSVTRWITYSEMPPLSSASSEGSTGMVPDKWLCK
jgi:hypothetical protein